MHINLQIGMEGWNFTHFDIYNRFLKGAQKNKLGIMSRIGPEVATLKPPSG